MKQNIKVAKELVKLAKNLIALDEEGDGSGFQMLHDYEKLKNMNDKIANKERLYRNFSGVIKWGQISGTVKNATFALVLRGAGYDNKCVDWYSGTWKDGYFYGTWKDGTWENGEFCGAWEDGTWENGEFCYGSWKNGTWKNGTLAYVNWYGGTWKNGTLKDSTWIDGLWQDGLWQDGVWQDGVWEKGKDKNRNEHGKDDSPDKWED